MERCEQKVNNYVAYDTSLYAARDFIHALSDKIAANSDTTGDLPLISARLQHITELASMLPQGRVKVEACISTAAVVSGDFDSSGQQSVLAGVDDIQKLWHQLEEHLTDAKKSLTDAVKQWNTYEAHRDAVDEWLRNEKCVKKEVMVSDVDEIRPLIKSCQVQLHVAAQ